MIMTECLQHCLSDCYCQSFQICEKKCQLCCERKGCNSFEISIIYEEVGYHNNSLIIFFSILVPLLKKAHSQKSLLATCYAILFLRDVKLVNTRCIFLL